MTVVNDPIGDLLTRIRNAQAARRTSCTAPWSKIKEQLCALLKKEGWIAGVETTGEAPKKQLVISFAAEKGALTLTRISKPGRRAYTSAKDLKSILRGFGMAILTTSGGLLTDRDARKRKLGGEVLCTIS